MCHQESKCLTQNVKEIVSGKKIALIRGKSAR
jgi:hypothetical protein